MGGMIVNKQLHVKRVSRGAQGSPTLHSRAEGIKTIYGYYPANSGGSNFEYISHPDVALKRGQRLVIHLSDPIPAKLAPTHEYDHLFGMHPATARHPEQQQGMALSDNPFFAVVGRTEKTLTIEAKRNAPIVGGGTSSGGTFTLQGMSKYTKVTVTIVP